MIARQERLVDRVHPAVATGETSLVDPHVLPPFLQLRRQGEDTLYWELSFGKRPREELYDLSRDPHCVTSLAGDPEQAGRKRRLRRMLFDALEAQDDPRMRGEGHVFDEYPYSDESSRRFYERYMRGERLNAGWVEPTDFEKGPVEGP